MPGHLARRPRLADQAGSSIVETLLGLMLLALVLAVGVQAFLLVQTRLVASAAAQDGVRAAADQGPAAGLSQADQVIAAGGGIGTNLTASVQEQAGSVTVTVRGTVPSLFAVGFVIPPVDSTATQPLEQYPTDEQATGT